MKYRAIQKGVGSIGDKPAILRMINLG
jgi:hypothetical protein